MVFQTEKSGPDVNLLRAINNLQTSPQTRSADLESELCVWSPLPGNFPTSFVLINFDFTTYYLQWRLSLSLSKATKQSAQFHHLFWPETGRFEATGLTHADLNLAQLFDLSALLPAYTPKPKEWTLAVHQKQQQIYFAMIFSCSTYRSVRKSSSRQRN